MRSLANTIVGRFLSLESIQFQTPLLFNDLVLGFTELKKEKGVEIQNSEYVNQITNAIRKHTGIRVALHVDEHGPMVDVPMLDKNNPLVTSMYRNMVTNADGMRLIAEAGGCVRGTVNLMTAKVTGIFAEITTRLYIPIWMVESTKYSAEEIAAATLHEIGHLFTYFEYINRSVTTNQVLAGMSKALDGSDSVEQREMVLIGVKKAMRLNNLDTKALALSTSSKVAEVVVTTNVVKQIESELGSNIYDMTAWEYLCDQFAARQGAGRHLVTCLDKLQRAMGNSMPFRNLPVYLLAEAIKLVLLFSGVYTLAGISLMVWDSSGRGSDYDIPLARANRLRNQIVENLKDKKLSKENHNNLLMDLDVIDQITSKMNDRRQWIGVLWDTLNPAARKSYNQEKLQQELEKLAVNDLFVSAAKIKHAA